MSDALSRIGFSPWVGLRELPRLDRHGQADRPGVYVVGDLADAPVLKAALRQGWDTGRHLADVLGGPDPTVDVDVLIAGAGPAGAACALALGERGLRYALIDRDRAFETIDRFPAGKVMYADPRGVPVPASLWFEDAPKEELVARWRADFAARGLVVREGESLGEVDGRDGAFTVRTSRGVVRCRKVVLALGRRGTPARLGVPGEDAAHVAHALTDPGRHAGEPVVVVGGGDSAVEAAVALADAGARVTLVHRGARLDRPRPRNRRRLEAARAAGTVRVLAPARVVAIAQDRVRTDAGDAEARAVYVLIGTVLPVERLRRLGVSLRSDTAREALRLAWILPFAALVWCFYVLKQHRELFPFSGALAAVHDALRIPAPWLPTADGGVRVLDAGFFGTALYAALVVGFGVVAMRRYRSPFQRRRYLSLIAFQAVFLFGVPELVAPAITTAASRWYSLAVPWPLSVWSLAHEPAAWGWLVAAALVAFVAIPLFVRRANESFCSWLCGCGGLAETVGDVWRWRAPRGRLAKRAEVLGGIVLLLAIPTTLLVLNDLWGLVGFTTHMDQAVRVGPTVTVGPDAADEVGDIRVAEAWVDGDRLHVRLEKREADGFAPNGWTSAGVAGDDTVYFQKIDEGVYALPVAALAGADEVRLVARTAVLADATAFARRWYALMVDFLLASIVGVALYPMLGNRVWCRFFCPLRAWMEWLSKRFGRLAIVADDKCISCGECTRYCQMGIDVQGFAQQQATIDNRNSACIQCGVCVAVCPVSCLTLVDKPRAGVPDGDPDPIGPRW